MTLINSSDPNEKAAFLQKMEGILAQLDQLIQLESQWKSQDTQSQVDNLEQYVESKKKLLDQMTVLFGGEEWQQFSDSEDPIDREISEKKETIGIRFKIAMLLHDEAMCAVQMQYDQAMTGLREIQQAKQYLSTHHAMRPTGQRIDISQ